MKEPVTVQWYEIVEGEKLYQGDILVDFPVVVPSSKIVSVPTVDKIPAEVLRFDLVIVSQTCDLADSNETAVVACPHFDFAKLQKDNPKAWEKGVGGEIQKGRRPRCGSAGAGLGAGLGSVDAADVITTVTDTAIAFVSRSRNG